MRRRGLLLGCLGVVVVGLLGGSVLMVGLARRIGPVETQVEANRAPVLVVLEHPRDGASYPSDSQIGIAARTLTGLPVASLQLWADGKLIKSESPVGGQLTQLSQSWVWTPGTAGDHTLVARALDVQGHYGTSNVVTIHAGAPATADLLVEAQSGDTLASLAEANQVELASARDENPGIDPQSQLEPGQHILLPLTAPSSLLGTAPPGPPPSSGGPAAAPNPILFWLRSHLAPAGTSALPPAAPALQLGVQGCDVTLAISEDAQDAVGLFVYRAERGSASFTRLRTLGPSSSQSVTDSGLTGPAEYYVSAFNDAGETPSDIAHAPVSPEQCAPATPDGIYLHAGSLHVSEALSAAYVYLSVDGGAWFRVPHDPHDFIKPDGGSTYPITSHLPPGMDPSAWGSVSGRLWGWQGGQLVHVGDFDQAALQPGQGSPIGGSASAQPDLGICNTRSCSGDVAGSFVDSAVVQEPGPWPFQWVPHDPQINGAVYQISDHPFSADCSMDPGQLSMTGTVPGTPEAGVPLQFTIDVSQLVAPSQANPSATIGGQPTPMPLNPTPALGASKLQQPAGQLGPAGLSDLLRNMWVSPASGNTLVTADGAAAKPPTYYIRVLPRVNNQILCTPSNSVQLKLEPGAEPPISIEVGSTQFKVADVRFAEPWFAGDNFGCFKILQDVPNIHGYHKGQTVCPPPYKGGNAPWYEQLFSFVTDAVNWVSKAYQDIQNALVDLASDVIPGCNSTSWCKTALKAGLKAGLAAMGLPPSLPNFDQLVELGKGSLTNVIAEYATDATGIPCDDTKIIGTDTSCKGVIRDGIDAVVEQARKSAVSASCGMSDQEAHNHGIDHGLCLSGIPAEPVPSGLQPGILKVTVERILDDSEHWPNGCSLHVQFPAVNEQAVGGEVVLPMAPIGVPINAPLHADLFQPMNAAIPDIGVGESATVPLVVQPNLSYLVPGYRQALGQLAPDKYDFGTNWATLYKGAMLTIDVGGNADAASQTSCVEGDQLQVGPLVRPASKAP